MQNVIVISLLNRLKNNRIALIKHRIVIQFDATIKSLPQYGVSALVERLKMIQISYSLNKTDCSNKAKRVSDIAKERKIYTSERMRSKYTLQNKIEKHQFI